MSSFRHRRRSSGHGSGLLTSARKASLQQQRDAMEQQSATTKRRQRLPDWLTAPVMLFAPPLALWLNYAVAPAVPAAADEGDNSLLQQQELLSPVGPLLVLVLAQLQLFFLWHLPAREECVFPAEEGQPPFRQRRTAFESCLLVCLLYILGAVVGLYPGQLVFLHWTSILFSLTLLSLLAIPLLFLLCPSPTSSSSSHPDHFSLCSQLFYGRHLQPVLLDVDVKAFLTCRLALTLWALYLLSALFAHRQLFPGCWPSAPLLVTAALQLVYVLRRQWFEHLHTGLDNQNDRAGFYRLWTVLGPLPSLYSLPVRLLALSAPQQQQEREIGPQNPLLFALLLIFFLGLLCQWLNTDIDGQRHAFRRANGALKLDRNGDKDPFYICAKFRKDSGEMGSGLLLGSGHWAHCRHPNYATEWLSFLCWTLPSWTGAGGPQSPMMALATSLPLLALALLLWVRMVRDELRCALKYGPFWSQHCQRVPHLLVPGFN